MSGIYDLYHRGVGSVQFYFLTNLANNLFKLSYAGLPFFLKFVLSIKQCNNGRELMAKILTLSAFYKIYCNITWKTEINYLFKNRSIPVKFITAMLPTNISLFV